jgi:hypothetical protein
MNAAQDRRSFVVPPREPRCCNRATTSVLRESTEEFAREV